MHPSFDYKKLDAGRNWRKRTQLIKLVQKMGFQYISEMFITLYESGLSSREVAKKTKLHATSIVSILHYCNVKLRNSGHSYILQKQNLKKQERTIIKLDKKGVKRYSKISKYKGVSWNYVSKKWQSILFFGGDFIHLGLSDTQEKAAEIYNNAIIEYREWDEFINIIYKPGSMECALLKIIRDEKEKEKEIKNMDDYELKQYLLNESFDDCFDCITGNPI